MFLHRLAVDYDENILLANICPCDLKKYVDPSLLDETGKEVLNNLLEDDNAVIVKYRLK
jgi:hypothetical protein